MDRRRLRLKWKMTARICRLRLDACQADSDSESEAIAGVEYRMLNAEC